MGAQTGVELDLDAVPLKDQSLTAWEILLSESQERMLVAVPPGKLAEARTILDRYEVAYAAIGRFTDSARLVATWHGPVPDGTGRGQKVADLEMAFLWGSCPIDPLEVAQGARTRKPLCLAEPKTAEEWSAAVRRVLMHDHCADQSVAGARFDTTVQGRTAIGPYGGATGRMPTNLYVSAPLRNKPFGIVFTVAFNPFYGEIDPPGMARLMMIEAITKAVVAGADYRQMALCDNFYTPRVRPEVAWDLKAMVEAIADLSLALGVPFISGKDSSSGTFKNAHQRIDVPPTLAVAALGRVPDVRQLVTKEFKRAGNRLLLLGHSDPEALGGSVYADCAGQRGDRLFDPLCAGPESIRKLWDALLDLHARGVYFAGSAIAEGGTLLRLFEASLGSNKGAHLHIDDADPGRLDGLLFGEFVGSVLLDVSPDFDLQSLPKDLPCRILGEVTGDPELLITRQGKVIWREPTEKLAESWAKPFREVVE